MLCYFFLSYFFLCSFSCCLTSKKFAWFPYLKQLFNIPFRFASSVSFECRLIREEKCISFAAGDNPLDSCNWNLCQLTPASLMPSFVYASTSSLLVCIFIFTFISHSAVQSLQDFHFSLGKWQLCEWILNFFCLPMTIQWVFYFLQCAEEQFCYT